MRYFIFLALVIGLNGCASKLDYQKQLAQTPICCERLQDIRYHPAVYDKVLTVNLGGKKKTPVRQFATGKSFFAAIQLPTYTAPYEIQITSLPNEQQLFWPTVQILDANFQLTQELGADRFTYSNGELSNHFFINQDVGYRYLLIYTKPNAIGKAGTLREVGASNLYLPAETGLFNLAYGVDQKKELKTAAGGKLQLRFIKYQPRALK